MGALFGLWLQIEIASTIASGILELGWCNKSVYVWSASQQVCHWKTIKLVVKLGGIKIYFLKGLLHFYLVEIYKRVSLSLDLDTFSCSRVSRYCPGSWPGYQIVHGGTLNSVWTPREHGVGLLCNAIPDFPWWDFKQHVDTYGARFRLPLYGNTGCNTWLCMVRLQAYEARFRLPR